MDIKKRRLELGLTQVDVARDVGVSLQAFILWEKQVNSPKPENEKKLREVLRIEDSGTYSGNHPR